MNLAAQELIDAISSLQHVDDAYFSQRMRKAYEEWRHQHPNEWDFSQVRLEDLRIQSVDFSNCDFRSAMFRGCKIGVNFRSANLSRAIFSGTCDLRGSSFINAACEGIDFNGCDLLNSKFNSANLKGACFVGSNLRGADFSNSNLSGANLLDITADTETRFNNLEDCSGSAIDSYTIACLGTERGGLTVGNLSTMELFNDVFTLRSQFGGIWTLTHIASIAAFLFPYIWFLGSHWAYAAFNRTDVEHSMSMVEALVRYIVTGGIGWHLTPIVIRWYTLGVFLLVLAYNTARFLLLWKTKTLETQEHVTGIPVRFSLASSRWWRTWFYITKYGFWASIILIALNSLHFLSMRIPLPN